MTSQHETYENILKINFTLKIKSNLDLTFCWPNQMRFRRQFRWEWPFGCFILFFFSQLQNWNDIIIWFSIKPVPRSMVKYKCEIKLAWALSQMLCMLCAIRKRVSHSVMRTGHNKIFFCDSFDLFVCLKAARCSIVWHFGLSLSYTNSQSTLDFALPDLMINPLYFLTMS